MKVFVSLTMQHHSSRMNTCYKVPCHMANEMNYYIYYNCLYYTYIYIYIYQHIHHFQ